MNTVVNPDEYYDHPHNTTIKNERCIELLLAFRFLEEFDNVIEIGAVTPYYETPAHTVVDPVDKKGTVKKFSQDIDYKGKNILCISTVEHMGRGDYGLGKDEELASRELLRMYNDSLNCLITFPVGYNRSLDYFIPSNIDNYFFYCRASYSNLWFKTTDPNCFKLEYNKNCVVCIIK
jgi:hypothetical protein